ncbi:DUF1329 domain-containing protein [Ideonella sp. TBM-1]|uniref:DUF1329 domain-containing protein n=2 Tax=Ideonella livida TaxID=2707176 RepID=A0A7C9TJ78_9BURK|nr:DUF1329 domain-containing protein [Ideonella livida]
MGRRGLLLLAGALCAGPALCAVSAEEAAALRTTLTPMGAERAGNKDGTIPAWNGVYSQMPAGYRSGQRKADPFAQERPVYTITARNLQQYADRLSEGSKALLKKYPDSFRIDVYPTHRTGGAPQWVYDNTLRNATQARLSAGGLKLEGAYGGVPFPIPKSGHEAMWNHLLRWQGEASEVSFRTYAVADGSVTMTSQNRVFQQFPYYRRDGSAESFKGVFLMNRVVTDGPANRAGEMLMLKDAVDQTSGSRDGWSYVVGQRRVRKSPSLAYDSPNEGTAGVMNFDELQVFSGPLDRYDWKIVGKREMVVPYHGMKALAVADEELVGPRHPNPDHLRWELHRVWVVEGQLAPGKRHVAPKRRVYLDEDTWAAVLGDIWDGQGQLWKFQFTLGTLVPEMPGYLAAGGGAVELVTGNWAMLGLTNGLQVVNRMVPNRPETFFTPEAMARDGVR